MLGIATRLFNPSANVWLIKAYDHWSNGKCLINDVLGPDSIFHVSNTRYYTYYVGVLPLK